MKITLKQLQVFVNTARTQSISLAANKCFISQAAASMSLSQLETMLEIKLFDRVGKRMKLNNNGQNLLSKATQVLEQVNEIESYAESEHEISGKIIIGASTTIANYILPKYIAKFRSIYPNTDIEIVQGNTKKIITLVNTLDCDIGFIEGKCDSNNIQVSSWKKDKLQVITSNDHKLTKKQNIKIADILKYEWATREQGSGTSDVFLDTLTTKYAKKLKTSIILNSSESIKQYVINSQSLACLSEAVLDNDSEHSKYSILNVEDLNIERSFYKIMLNKKYHSKLTTVFSDFMTI